MEIVTDTLEGVINGVLSFHYDITSDVLYLRLLTDCDAPTLAEETPQGFLLLRRESDDQPVGLTVINWWKRFGRGPLPDSIRELEHQIEPWAARLAAYDGFAYSEPRPSGSGLRINVGPVSPPRNRG